MAKQALTNVIEMQLNGTDWVDVSSDVIMPFSCNYGILTPSILARIGRIGSLKITLDNANPTYGKYSPDHTNALSGFEIGVGIRWIVYKTSTPANKYYKFVGSIKKIEPQADTYGGSQTTLIVANDWLYDAANMNISSVPAQVDKTIDEIVTEYLTYTDNLPNITDFSTGENIFSFAGTAGGSKTALLSELRRLADSEPSYIYMKGCSTSDGTGGVLVVENASSRDTDVLASSATVSTDLIKLKTVKDVATVYNDIRCTVHPSIVDTNEVRIFELQSQLDVPVGGTTIFQGAYRDSDNPDAKVGAYNVQALVDSNYDLWSDSDGYGYASNAIKARFLKYSTDTLFYWAFTDLSAEDEYSSNYDMEIIGNPAITSDGVGGWDYLLLNSTNDNAYGSNTNITFHEEQGSFIVYALHTSPTIASSNITSTDPYITQMFRWGSSNTTDGGDFRLTTRRLHSAGVPLRYFTTIQLITNDLDKAAQVGDYNIAINSDWEAAGKPWTQYAVTWDFHWNSTDEIDLNLYINGDLKADMIDQGDSDLRWLRENGKEKPSSDMVWNIYEGVYNGFWERWLHNYGISHFAVFDKMLLASDIMYNYTNGSDQVASVSVVAGGTGPEITVVNDQDAPVYLGRLDLYGKLLTDLTPLDVNLTDSNSINTYGVSGFSLDMAYQDNLSVAKDTTESLLLKLKDPKSQITSMSFIANTTSDTVDYFLDIEPGNAVSISEDMTAIGDDDFIVNGVQYTVYQPDIVEVSWVVYPR